MTLPIILLLVAGTVQAMEKQPLLSHLKKIISLKNNQFTTEVADIDALAFDTSNPDHFLMGTKEGLELYDTIGHAKGKCKLLPREPFYSVRSNDSIVAFSAGSAAITAGVWNRTTKTISGVVTKGNQYVPSRVRLKKNKLIVFDHEHIDLYDMQSLSKGSIQSLINDNDVHNLVTSAHDDELISWDNEKICFWDIREKKPVQISNIAATSVAPNCTKIIVGTRGNVLCLDRKKLKEPIASINVGDPKAAVAVKYKPHTTQECIAVCGNTIHTINADFKIIKTYIMPHKVDWIECKPNNENVMALGRTEVLGIQQGEFNGIARFASIINLKQVENNE